MYKTLIFLHTLWAVLKNSSALSTTALFCRTERHTATPAPIPLHGPFPWPVLKKLQFASLHSLPDETK